MSASSPKERKGKVFLVNASQVFAKGDPKNFIPDAGIQRIVDTLARWKEEEKLSRIVDHQELAKSDYYISPSRHIHTSDAETYQPIAEIVEELIKVIEVEARETDKALAPGWTSSAVTTARRPSCSCRSSCSPMPSVFPTG